MMYTNHICTYWVLLLRLHLWFWVKPCAMKLVWVMTSMVWATAVISLQINISLYWHTQTWEYCTRKYLFSRDIFIKNSHIIYFYLNSVVLHRCIQSIMNYNYNINLTKLICILLAYSQSWSTLINKIKKWLNFQNHSLCFNSNTEKTQKMYFQL